MSRSMPSGSRRASSNRESRIILDALKRHGVKAELWVLLDFGGDRATGAEQERRIDAAVAKLRPLAEEAGKIGCSLALYNHGGWFGEPENQIAIIERLKGKGVTNVGMVYNLHHGHEHLDRFPELLVKMKPYLKAVNLNGMDPGGDRVGRKILPLGQGERDLELLRIIRDSGYRGPIGILGHTMDDAEERLQRQPRRPGLAVAPARRQGPRPSSQAADACPSSSGRERLDDASECEPGRGTDPGRPARTVTPSTGPRSSPRRSSPASRATASAIRAARSAPT